MKVLHEILWAECHNKVYPSSGGAVATPSAKMRFGSLEIQWKSLSDTS